MTVANEHADVTTSFSISHMPVLASLAMIVLTSVLTLSPVWLIIWSAWTQLGSYEHGLVIALLFGFLMYKRVGRLSGPLIATRSLLYASVVAGAVFFSAASQVCAHLSIELPAVAAIPVILSLGFFVAIGERQERLAISAMPLYLYCALPVWDQFSTVLQMITVSVVSASLQLLGVLAYVDGTFVYLAEGTFEIAQGCSGLRFFLTAAAISLFFSAFNNLTAARSTALLCAMLMMSLVLNWIRVSAIVLSGDLFGMDTFVVRSHYFLGWLLFAVALVVVGKVADRFGLLSPSPIAAPAAAGSDLAGPE